MSRLLQLQTAIKQSLCSLQSQCTRISEVNTATLSNNTTLVPKLVQLISEPSRSLQVMLQFMSDMDIMKLATVCKTAYRVIYSPLGFTIMRHLRPIVIKEEKLEEEVPDFSQSTVDRLCSDRSLRHVDEDDKAAILLTMRTNILATKQKIRELDLLTKHYGSKSKEMVKQIIMLGHQREQESRKLSAIRRQYEKLRELLAECQGHASSLKEEQQKIEINRQTNMLVLNAEKSKLHRQKELLAKKIRSQQAEKEHQLVRIREIRRIMGSLHIITDLSFTTK